MELLADKEDRQVWFTELSRPYNLETPFPRELFVCILFANEETVSTNEQAKLCEQIVDSGCRYAVCAGHNCEAWHDAIDLAYLATDANFSPPPNAFMMTTWHEDESVNDIIFFALMNTNFDNHEFRRFLVLFVGSDDRTRGELQPAIHAVWQ